MLIGDQRHSVWTSDYLPECEGNRRGLASASMAADATALTNPAHTAFAGLAEFQDELPCQRAGIRLAKRRRIQGGMSQRSIGASAPSAELGMTRHALCRLANREGRPNGAWLLRCCATEFAKELWKEPPHA